jgi:hypothetical protein
MIGQIGEANMIIGDGSLEYMKMQAILSATRRILNPKMVDVIRNDENFRKALRKLTPGTVEAVLTEEDACQAWIDSDDAARQAIKNYNPWKEEI